jgi:Predicted unsaturated glucuronyl hydrolase involved in regulation of bacterial surface properties, and related proteins
MNKIFFVVVGIALAFSISQAQTTTWAVDFSNAIITRWPTNIESMTAKTKWEYSNGIILHGMEKVYEHTKNASYLSYIKKWVDSYVGDNGVVNIDTSLHSLDQIQPAVLCLFLYKETGTAKYKAGADYILSYLAKQPKNASGGFWHKATYPNQMWTDGIYMAEPFVSKYGFRIGSTGYCDSIATFQPALLYSHAYGSASKLLVHAWDETKKAAWADATTGLSPCVWSRGMGWYSAGMVDLLKYLPKTHPQYSAMISILGNIAEGIKNSQDAATGLWHQVTDKGSQSDDYLETSGSGLFIYSLKTAVDCGFIDKSYLAVAQKGWTGLKNKFTLDSQGMPVINDFVAAMSASASYALYVAAPLVACPPSTAPHGYCAALYAASAMELQTIPKYRLTINVVGQGSVTNPSGEMFLDSGSTVTLTAAPGSGYHLGQWSGDASGTAATAAVTMNAEKTVSATFAQGSSIINYSLVNADGGVYVDRAHSATKIRLSLRSAQSVFVEVFNSNGRKVVGGDRVFYQSGTHTIDLNTRGLPVGNYIVKLNCEKALHTLQLTIVE